MINKRQKIEVDRGEGEILHRILIESIEMSKDSEESRLFKMNLFREIVNSPEVIYFNFDNFSIKYTQGKWIVESNYLERNGGSE